MGATHTRISPKMYFYKYVTNPQCQYHPLCGEQAMPGLRPIEPRTLGCVRRDVRRSIDVTVTEEIYEIRST